jgi:hypothetical protein
MKLPLNLLLIRVRMPMCGRQRINASRIAGTVYSDSTVANNTTYYYAATSIDVSGVESKKTTAVKVVIP